MRIMAHFSRLLSICLTIWALWLRSCVERTYYSWCKSSLSLIGCHQKHIQNYPASIELIVPMHLFIMLLVIVVYLFCLMLYVPVNSYGHVRMVSSPNHTFFLGNLPWLSGKPVLHSHTLACSWQQHFLNQQEENGRRNYFMINLEESIGWDPDPTRDPWICSQTHYRLCYPAGHAVTYGNWLCIDAGGNILISFVTSALIFSIS